MPYQPQTTAVSTLAQAVAEAQATSIAEGLALTQFQAVPLTPTTGGNRMSVKNLITLWREYKHAVEENYYTLERAKERLRDDMKDRMVSEQGTFRRMPWYYRLHDLQDALQFQFNGQLCDFYAYIKSSKAKARFLGDELAHAIQNDDADKALRLINATTNRNIRDNARTDWADFMNEHFFGEYCRCDDCNVIEEDNAGGANTYDGDYWVCSSCLDDGYRWSDNRETYITVDDWHEEEEEEIGRAHV